MKGRSISHGSSNILKRVTIDKSPWIKLERIFYTDSISDELNNYEDPGSIENLSSTKCNEDGSPLNLSKEIKYWDIFTRNLQRNNLNVHSATVLAFCYKLVNGSYSFYVCVVEQFRASAGSKTLEFPAGICDRNESVVECGLRELKEETGYTGVCVKTSPCLPTSVLVDDNTCLLTVLVDLDLDVNLNPVQSLEPTENVIPHLFPLNNMLNSLENHTSKSGAIIAESLYFFTYSLSFVPYEYLQPKIVEMVKSSKLS